MSDVNMPCLCRIAPLPGSHCSVVIILYPGDLLKASGQKIRTSIRHADPQTVKEWHRDEAIRVLKFFREAVMAELRCDGRKWEWAKPSEEEVQERLADCDHPLRDKVPNAVRDGDAGSGLLAMSALLWARMDLLTGGLRRSATSMDKVYVSGLKKLRTDMVAWIKKLVARKRAGQVGVAADACDDDGEEVHSAFQAVGIARTVADARGTTIGKPGGGVDGDDAEAGKGISGTKEKHQDKDRDEDRMEEGGSEEDREEGRLESESESELKLEGEEEEEEQEKQEEVEHKEQEQEKQLEGEQEEEVELEVEEEEEHEEVVAAGAAETGERLADVEKEEGEGKGAMSADLKKEKEEVGVEAAHGGSGNVVVGDWKEGVDLEAVGEGDNTAATKQTGVEVTHGGERSRKKKAASGHPGSTAAGRQARLDVVEQLRAENRRLRSDNARLERRLGEQTGRVDSLASALAGVLDKLKALTAQVADTDRNLTKRLEDATPTMATTITDNLTDNMASAVEAGKSFAELAAKILQHLDNPNGRMAVERATQVNALAEHVTNEVGEARKFLEDIVIKYIGAAQTNIAADVAPRLVVQQPPPPIAPAQALPEELMKSFKEEVLKAVTEGTQQSFFASGLKIMTEVVSTVAPARRGSSPSVNDADQPHPKEAQKHGQKRGGGGGGGDGEDATSVKRSKGAGGSRVADEGSKGAGGSRIPGEGSKGVGDTGAGDSSAKQPKTVVDILKRHWATGSGGKGLSDKETPTAKTAPLVSAKTGNGPNAKIVEATAVPKQPPAGARHPTSASADVPPADKDSRAWKGAAAANALKDQLRLLAGHRAAQQPPPPVAEPSASVPRVAPAVAARTPANPKSALLRKQLGTRGSTAPTQQEVGSRATLTSGNVAAPTPVAADVEKAAEKGVRATLATGGSPIEEVAPDADIAAIYAQLDAAKPRTLTISDTAHAEQPASPAGGSEDCKTTNDVVGEGKAKRKGKAGSQRKTREKSEVKAMGKGKEKAEEKERRGHGIRHDSSGDGQGWVGEIKVHGINRYIGKSSEKMELAYVHSIAFVVYDGFVSKVLMDELTGLDTAELERWGKVWEEVKILPTGMWTVMWDRGVLLPKTWLNDILDTYHECKSSGDALHGALWPAMWFPVEGVPEEKSAAMMSAMIGRVSMCVAYGKTVASASKKEGDKEEKTAMAAWALVASACAVWCFVENDDTKVADAVEEGKAAALIAGASNETAKVFETVMAAVLNAEITRDRPLGEVTFNVAPALQSLALQRVYPGGNAGVDAEVVARAMVETMAFWGMCPVAGPKLKKRSIAVPCVAQMKADLDNRGRKGQRGKKGTKGKKGKDGTGKKGRKGKDSTAA
ncbi:unnamed protein product [Closterium sp. NIES-65]|nr:unnamed protein product [Closterium sp. NIES-65]